SPGARHPRPVGSSRCLRPRSRQHVPPGDQTSGPLAPSNRMDGRDDRLDGDEAASITTARGPRRGRTLQPDRRTHRVRWVTRDPGTRLRDIAATLGITERSAYGIVTDLTEGGYVVKEKDGRLNRYQIQAHLALREAITQERTIGEVLDVLVETNTRRRRRRRPR